MQDPYVSRTSIDTLSPTNWLKIKVLLGYVFLSRGRTGVSVVGDWLFINALLKWRVSWATNKCKPFSQPFFQFLQHGRLTNLCPDTAYQFSWFDAFAYLSMFPHGFQAHAFFWTYLSCSQENKPSVSTFAQPAVFLHKNPPQMCLTPNLPTILYLGSFWLDYEPIFIRNY